MRLLVNILSLALFCLIGCLIALVLVRICIIVFNTMLAWVNKLMQQKVDSLKQK